MACNPQYQFYRQWLKSACTLTSAVNGTPSHSYGVSLAIYVVTQCYPPLGTSEESRLNPMQPERPVPDLPTPEGWKAELT